MCCSPCSTDVLVSVELLNSLVTEYDNIEEMHGVLVAFYKINNTVLDKAQDKASEVDNSQMPTPESLIVLCESENIEL
jgi:AAA+ superfamily predicted ATPase